MPKSLINQTYTELLNTVVALICGEEGVSLVHFADKFEQLIAQLVTSKIQNEELQKLLLNVEVALKNKDLIHLFDAVQNIEMLTE